MPFVPALPAAATMMTPCATARSIAACSTTSRLGPPRLMLITAGLAPSCPAIFRSVMYTIPRAIIEDQPKPLCFSTFTGMIVALGAIPLIGEGAETERLRLVLDDRAWEIGRAHV